VFSPDSRRLAYVAGSGGKEFVVNEGTAQETFDLVLQPLAFSPTASISATSGSRATGSSPSWTA
jgi:hypothetical protein